MSRRPEPRAGNRRISAELTPNNSRTRLPQWQVCAGHVHCAGASEGVCVSRASLCPCHPSRRAEGRSPSAFILSPQEWGIKGAERRLWSLAGKNPCALFDQGQSVGWVERSETHQRAVLGHGFLRLWMGGGLTRRLTHPTALSSGGGSSLWDSSCASCESGGRWRCGDVQQSRTRSLGASATSSRAAGHGSAAVSR
jgi:hypothetical protein